MKSFEIPCRLHGRRQGSGIMISLMHPRLIDISGSLEELSKLPNVKLMFASRVMQMEKEQDEGKSGRDS